ncbi:uncharacterized protein DDB_G0283697-like isoform X2 [Coccinella septempunctata]|uniref:uncharacterized protein DDB_G0283697-like isoform X2 n=1 Tax=Coccinella septempunctata TaxID=41139 RepID=UPI001D0667AC|nr:uncharacterized protein DDB_G0283697-like isoform X2 [Coccinella septempunctata]
MNTSVDKSSKKRKSLGGQNKTPAKAAKLDESVKLSKEKDVVEANNVNSAKSPKKQIKPENKITVTKSENGVSPKLKKFKGTKSLEEKSDVKTENAQKKKENKKKKSTNMGKKVFLLEKMQQRAKTEGKEVVIKLLNEKIDSIISRSEMTKSAKRTLKNYKFILKDISGEERTVTLPKPAQKQNKNKKQTEEKKVANTTATAAKAVKAKDNKKQKPVQKVEEKKAAEPKKEKKPVKKVEEEDDEESDDDDVETSFKDVKNAEFEDDSEMDAEEEESDDDEEASDEEMSGEEDEEESGEEEEDEASDEEDDDDEEDDEEEKPVKKVESKKKALDLNGSQLKNRRIKVEYTQGGNKNGEDKKKQIKAKNFKLHAMRKQGQKGSPNKGQNKGSPFKGKNKK